VEYPEVPVIEAYELLNAGGMVLLCTRSHDGRYDLAPIAWNCPLDYAPASRLILVCDTGHRSYEDLQESGEFAVALPTAAQRGLIERSGAVSGRDADKYASLGIESFPAGRVDALVPAGVSGWLECRLLRIVIEGTSAVVMGEVLRAAARKDAWKERIHFVREGLWFAPGPEMEG
jgi:flavin reductase (DIM6/NTAB) family NADH-FMN oxidoreductase RutF